MKSRALGWRIVIHYDPFDGSNEGLWDVLTRESNMGQALPERSPIAR